jgi:hypothetical protein
MAFQHQQLADGRWFELSFFEQMANVGSEIERTISWKNKNNPDYSRQAFFRGLELIDLTISDIKNQSRLREITRTREALVDYFVYDNEYHSNNKQWQNYFNYFLWKVRGS